MDTTLINPNPPTSRTAKELSEAVEALVLFKTSGMVPKADAEFVNSLCLQHSQKGTLSEKQSIWVFKLMHKFMGITEAPVTLPNTGGINYDALFSLMEKAGTKLQKPKLYFTLQGGFKLKVYLGYGASSLNICQHDPYNKIGWITRSSAQFNKAQWYKDTETLTGLIMPFMETLAKNPEQTIVRYGKMGNACCFCNLPLSDDKSITAGYGPTCAKNYGLPWGLVQ